MKLSIITVNRNNAEGLVKTMTSVFCQSYSDLEYIIVDGASTDDSTRIAEDAIKRQTLLTPERIIFSSEPDSGIYNAMNKGIAKASGEYLLFLNSGDSLVGDCLKEISGKLTADFVIGRENITKGENVISTTDTLTENDLTLYNIYLKGVPHQATFIKRSLFENDKYDETLRINADWKVFVQKIVLENASVSLIDTVVSNFDGEGISSTNMEQLLAERERVFKDLLPVRIADNYLKVFPHYYEVKRVQWLLRHRFFYKAYRLIASTGMKFIK